jgi:hypothetical protein
LHLGKTVYLGSALVFLAALVPLVASAQNHWGAFIEYRNGVLQEVDRTPGAINKFHTSGTGTSNENRFGGGISYEQFFSDSTAFSLSYGLSYQYMSSGFTSDPYNSVVGTTATTNRFDLKSTGNFIGISAMPSYSASGWRFGAGLWLHQLFGFSQDVTEHIISPSGATFPDGATTSATHESSPAGSGTEFGFRFAVGKTFDLGSFHPEIQLFTDLTPSSVSDIGFFSSFAPGISISVPFGAKEKEVEAPPLATSVPLLLLRFDGRALRTSDTIGVAIQERSIREYIELNMRPEREALHYLAKLHLLAKEEADRFDPLALARKGKAAADSEVINILGWRLRELQTATLVIEGKKSDVEFAAEYLHSIWNIRDEHIAKIFNEALATLRFSSQDARIMLPLALRWVEIEDHLSPLTMEMPERIDARLAVRLSQDNEQLLERDYEAGADVSKGLNLILAKLDTKKPLYLALIKTDSSGDHEIARDTVYLREEHNEKPQEVLRIVFAGSGGDSVIIRSRDLLFSKLSGFHNSNLIISGTPDAEARELIARLEPYFTKKERAETTAPGWTITVEAE